MSANPGNELSPVQKRFLTLTKEYGLEDDEALYALGRRSGGMPAYRKLSRQSQFNKMQELLSLGVTQEEAERVVGVSSTVNAGKRLQPRTPTRKPVTPTSSPEAGAQPRCSGCGQAKEGMMSFAKGVWVCSKCQKKLRKARKAEQRRRDFAEYYNALMDKHP